MRLWGFQLFGFYWSPKSFEVAEGLGFSVSGAGFIGFKVAEGLGFSVSGAGFGVQDLGFRVLGGGASQHEGHIGAILLMIAMMTTISCSLLPKVP